MNTTLDIGKGIARSVSEPTEAEREVLRAIRAVQYGAVEVTIHESRIVQVERTEKIRLTKKSEGGERRE
jgi:hypothetical protein